MKPLLSPQLQRLLEPLRRGHPVPVERLVAVLYDGHDDGGPEDAAGAVHAQIWHLRQRLARHDIAIETVGRGPGSHGYRVAPAHLARLEAIGGMLLAAV